MEALLAVMLAVAARVAACACGVVGFTGVLSSAGVLTATGSTFGETGMASTGGVDGGSDGGVDRGNDGGIDGGSDGGVNGGVDGTGGGSHSLHDLRQWPDM